MLSPAKINCNIHYKAKTQVSKEQFHNTFPNCLVYSLEKIKICIKPLQYAKNLNDYA